MPTYQIADVRVRYSPQYDMSRLRSEKYRCDDDGQAPRLNAHVENARLLREECPHLTPEECEYMEIGREFYCLLLLREGMMLHASAVVVDGFAYLFSAPSGTGKSTHTSLWLRQFGERAYLLNDDKPALRALPDGVFAYGTPFSGKHDLSVNARVPVRGIAFLERSEDNRIERIRGRDALFALLNQTVRPHDVSLYTRLLQVIQSVTQTVPIYRLYCNMDPQAAELSYEAMKRGE